MVLAFKSGSRGQVIGMIFVVLLLLPMKYTNISSSKKLMYVLFGIAAIFGAVTLGVSNSDLGGRWEQTQLETHGLARVFAALDLLKIWVNDPVAIIFGFGNSSSYALIGGYPHNVPAEILGEEGILGFTLYISILYVTFKAWRNVLTILKNTGADRTSIVILGGLFLYEIVLSLKQGTLLGTALVFTFSIMILVYEKIVVLDSSRKVSITSDTLEAENNNRLVVSKRVLLKKHFIDVKRH